MNILLDLERMRYPNTGISNVFQQLHQEISPIISKSGMELSIYAPDSYIERHSKNISWKPYHKFFESFSKKFDLIHVSHQLSSYFQSNYSHTKKLVTLHDLNFLHEDMSERRRSKFLKKVQANLRFTDHIACISEFTKKDFITNEHVFQLKKKVELSVVPNGVNFNSDLKEKPPKNFSWKSNKKYILQIGVLFPKKNQLLSLQMLEYLPEDYEIIFVYSASKADYHTSIEDVAKNFPSRVHFLKNISEEEKIYLLKNVYALVHPGIAEGFGLPPIEAMYFSKPVFLSTYTSLPEIGGDEAYYFKTLQPESMAQTVLNNLPKFYKDPDNGIQNKKRALQFSSAQMAKNYYKIYEKMLIP